MLRSRVQYGEQVTDEEDRHAWERPGAFEVAPGVYRIPLPLPGDALKAVNTYAIADGDHIVMIDGGWAMADATDVLESALGQIGFRIKDVREFLVTHVHRDHYTQAVAIRRVTGAEVSLGEAEKATLDALRVVSVHPDVASLRAAGAAELSEALARWDGERDLTDWEYPDHWLFDGVDLPLRTRTLRVIATPGHTVGDVVFHDPEAGMLFAGDHVLPHITPSIGVEISRPPSPLRNYLDSLRIVRALPDARLLPAHGPVTDSTHVRVEELLRHHEDRLTATADAVAAGAHTGFEVAARIGWTRRQRKLAELDMFNQIMAVHETMAHLEVLVERGWLTRTVVDGITQYQRA
jgi:glyoxylase-like metal-dependent hydrolase (beta-lactamase superfamily II)